MKYPTLAALLVALTLCSVACRRPNTPQSPDTARPPTTETSAPLPPTGDGGTSGETAQVVPGLGIGPVALGATSASLTALGFTVSAGPDGTSTVGPYRVRFNAAGEAESVEVYLRDLPGGLFVGPTLIPPGATVEQIGTLLGDCAPPEGAMGGTFTTCANGGLRVKAAGPARVVSLEVRRESGS